MKDVVIIANFCRDFSETDNGRFMYLCKELSKEHKVEIITSDFLHGMNQHKEPLNHNWPFTITFLHEPGYKKNISIRRFISHHSWGKEVRKYLKKREKPDVVYCAVPSLTAPYEAAKYCKRNGVRFIIDIQDLWPEAFRMVFKIPIVSDVIFAPLKYRADEIYKRADAVCGVSETYVERGLSVNRKCRTGITVFLGTNISTFDAYAKEYPVLIKQNDEVWLAYCGTLGSSYDLTCIIDALSILTQRGIKIKLVVMDSGERKDEFEKYAKDKKIDHIFTGKLPYDQMRALLFSCDITVNLIAHNAVQSIINKHGDYASKGLPVVSTQENDEPRALVEKYQMRFNCKNGDVKDLADKLEILALDKELRQRMGNYARQCVEEKFARVHSYKVFENVILESEERYYIGVKPQNELWIGYCGSLSDSYDIPCVIRSLKKISTEYNLKPKFVVIGDGAKRKEFEELAIDADINVLFTGRLDYKHMCGFLCGCDIVVNPICRGSAASIINKHGDYAMSGKPIVNTQESNEYRNLVDRYEMGFNCINGDYNDMAEKLRILLIDKDLRENMGKNARRCGKELFDRAKTYEKLIDCALRET